MLWRYTALSATVVLADWVRTSFSELSWALCSRLSRWSDKIPFVGSEDTFSWRGTTCVFHPRLSCRKRTSNCSKWQLPDTVSSNSWAGRETLPGFFMQEAHDSLWAMHVINSLLWPGFSSHCCPSEQTVLYTETSVLLAWRKQRCRWSQAGCTKPQKPTTKSSSKCGSGFPPREGHLDGAQVKEGSAQKQELQ